MVRVLLLLLVTTCSLVTAVDLTGYKQVRKDFPDASAAEVAAILAAAGGSSSLGPESVEQVDAAGEVAAVLGQLDLAELLPVLTKHGIKTQQDLLLLDAESVKYLGITLGAQLRLLRYINDGKQENARDARQAHTASLVAEIVDKKIEENNAKLLAEMRAMAAGSHMVPRELQQSSSGAARALNTEGTSLWVEDDDAAIKFGTQADTDLKRAGAGVLSTSGALQIGDHDDLTCDDAHKGTLRSLTEAGKTALEFCNGQKWAAAGGAVLDAADQEPCSADNPGALQFDNTHKILTVCNGAGAYRTVIVADPAGRTTLPASIKLAMDGLCNGDREGALRYNPEDTAVEVCVEGEFKAIYEPPPPANCKILKGQGFGSGTYTVFPIGFDDGVSVYCDMDTDGGGWTLVRIDDNGNKDSIRSKHAVGSMPDTLSCNGANTKFSDEFIIALWTEPVEIFCRTLFLDTAATARILIPAQRALRFPDRKLRLTAKISFDHNGEMNLLSETDISSLSDKHFTGKCGSSNVIRWYFKSDSQKNLSPTGTHGHMCGWSYGPCAGHGVICWYGPHGGHKNHMNSGGSHVSIPTYASNAGGEQGCTWGWVK